MPTDLYKGKIPVIYRSLDEGFVSSEAPPAAELGTGAVPRDYAADPVEMRDSPSAMQLYDDSEWDALIQKGDEAEDSLEHIVLRGIERGEFEFLDQSSFPDCWCHSTAHAAMVDALKQGLPVPRINAVAMATLMGRTDGGWCGLSMKFGRENGYPLVGSGPGKWSYQSRRGQDTPELRAEMAKRKNLEDWYDLGRQAWDQKLSRRQIATCLFNNLPAPSDYNRFGHSMLSLRVVRIEPGLYGLLTLNSWKRFGYKGLCVLANMWPDGACALRATTPAA